MSIGVDWDTFWNLNPHFLKAFVEADRIRKRQIEAEMYVQGKYVCDAVSIALSNAFAKKGSTPTPWMEEPYRLLPFTKEEEAERARTEREKAIAFFNAMIPKQGGEENGS